MARIGLIGHFFYKPPVLPEYEPSPDVREYYEKKDWFERNYKERMDRFFESTNAIMWGGTYTDNIHVTIKGRNGYFTIAGHFVLDDDGEIIEWRSNVGEISLKRESLSISEEMLAAQIKGLLTDDERASRYCEQVSMSLLEDGSCVFNAPYGLKLKESEYEERYHSKEWEDAWIASLKEEFHAKDVCRDEKAGIGCFRLQAI